MHAAPLLGGLEDAQDGGLQPGVGRRSPASVM